MLVRWKFADVTGNRTGWNLPSVEEYAKQGTSSDLYLIGSLFDREYGDRFIFSHRGLYANPAKEALY
jgi:hypothetical protein